MSTSPPYGYLKDPADHNHLIIDEKAAPVVKLIFQMALDGAGIGKIRNHLNASHILRPAAYAAAERGESGYERHFEGKEDKAYISFRILRNGVMSMALLFSVSTPSLTEI